MSEFYLYRWLRGGVWFFDSGVWVRVHPDNQKVALDAAEKGLFPACEIEDHRYFRSKP